MQDQDARESQQRIDQAKALFASALASDTSFWRAELARHQYYDEGYFAIEMTVTFDLADAIDLRSLTRALPLTTMTDIGSVAKRLADGGLQVQTSGEHASIVRVWPRRLYCYAHKSRPDMRDVDALLSVFATMFGAHVTTVISEVVRPMRGHFEDNPVNRKGRKAQEFFLQFAIGTSVGPQPAS